MALCILLLTNHTELQTKYTIIHLLTTLATTMLYQIHNNNYNNNNYDRIGEATISNAFEKQTNSLLNYNCFTITIFPCVPCKSGVQSFSTVPTLRSEPYQQETMHPVEEITLSTLGRAAQNLHPEPEIRKKHKHKSKNHKTQRSPTPPLEQEYRSPAEEFHSLHIVHNRRGNPPPQVTPRPLQAVLTSRSTDQYDEFGYRKSHDSQYINAYADQSAREEDC